MTIEEGGAAVVADSRVEISCKDGKSFFCDEGDTILSAALRSGIGLAYECNAGGCGSCKVLLESGDVFDMQPDAPGIKPRERERGKVLACQCKPTGPCAVSFKEDEECIPKIAPRIATATFVGSRAVTHDLREFTFRVSGGMNFIAGQYALLSLPGVNGRRSYSMSNLANEDGIVQFMIRRVPNGKATKVLFEDLQEGADCVIDGPYSSAFLREDTTREIVCIAGGSGLAPMVSVVRGALASSALENVRVHLYYGGREPKDIFSLDLFDELAAAQHRLEFVPACSCAPELLEDWTGERGFVHDCVAKNLADKFANCEFYMAGPPPMVDAVRRMLLLEHSVAAERVHYDRFF
ncbi:2Fe-2S iron-sulfur cluster-binding protein [Caballeronia sp. LZ029]|uniref:2Fe-2S iron-sulfur cluster-binding protein n=1 Tax=Caballeronia sp. LZ029 TaxID=3038564 RepID=UPI00285DFEDE|nr:2Fe-2S iron-sulfur cluster-binding protein [Caballeronia sp. LZ029]MDR5749040.1 2Fe-2S iron-sulfur cluster-binding protein [Caballeronia sp. LZ029]